MKYVDKYSAVLQQILNVIKNDYIYIYILRDIPVKRFQIDEPYFRFDILKLCIITSIKRKTDRYSRLFQFRYYEYFRD